MKPKKMSLSEIVDVRGAIRDTDDCTVNASHCGLINSSRETVNNNSNIPTTQAIQVNE